LTGFQHEAAVDRLQRVEKEKEPEQQAVEKLMGEVERLNSDLTTEKVCLHPLLVFISLVHKTMSYSCAAVMLLLLMMMI
jgi:hypothetical protein